MGRGLWLRLALLVVSAVAGNALPATARAQSPAAPTFEIPQAGVAFSTGDTWTQNGHTMRLYGVQSCIRGTTFTNQAGMKADCGEASLAYLAALVRDTKPRCAPIAQVGHSRHSWSSARPTSALRRLTWEQFSSQKDLRSPPSAMTQNRSTCLILLPNLSPRTTGLDYGPPPTCRIRT